MEYHRCPKTEKPEKNLPLTKAENLFLIKLVSDNKIVASKVTNGPGNQKEEAWTKITNAFNEAVDSGPRRKEHLLVKWDNLKKAARKRALDIRGQMTYGQIRADEVLEKVSEILGESDEDQDIVKSVTPVVQYVDMGDNEDDIADEISIDECGEICPYKKAQYDKYPCTPCFTKCENSSDETCNSGRGCFNDQVAKCTEKPSHESRNCGNGCDQVAKCTDETSKSGCFLSDKLYMAKYYEARTNLIKAQTEEKRRKNELDVLESQNKKLKLELENMKLLIEIDSLKNNHKTCYRN